jgi:hypothetical protein
VCCRRAGWLSLPMEACPPGSASGESPPYFLIALLLIPSY